MKHKHADLIHAWADGDQIQFFYNNQWLDSVNPSWHKDHKYRIKPEPKPDIVRYYEVNKQFGGLSRMPYHNIKATYDGETGALKLSEVIK